MKKYAFMNENIYDFYFIKIYHSYFTVGLFELY